MLIVAVATFVCVWALWLGFMCFHPTRWEAFVDWEHEKLAKLGLSVKWMQRVEKSFLLKGTVALTIFIGIVCLALLLKGYRP